jgi:hypothetical protein
LSYNEKDFIYFLGLIQEEIKLMLGKNKIRKSVTLLTAVAVWCVYSMVAFAAAKDLTGEITVTGQVTVNGQTAVSNSTIVSGSTIVTGADSSAIISLGKAGRVELAADSNLILKFSDGSITGVLSQGKARVSNVAGVAATITTKDAAIIADAGQANSFAVQIVECSAGCSSTEVDTMTGLVTMRSNGSDKQISAGTTASAGNLSQTGCKPCLRPGSSTPVPVVGLSTGAIAAILGAIAAGVGAAIFLSRDNGDVILDGGTTVISPNR